MYIPNVSKLYFMKIYFKHYKSNIESHNISFNITNKKSAILLGNKRTLVKIIRETYKK